MNRFESALNRVAEWLEFGQGLPLDPRAEIRDLLLNVGLTLVCLGVLTDIHALLTAGIAALIGASLAASAVRFVRWRVRAQLRRNLTDERDPFGGAS